MSQYDDDDDDWTNDPQANSRLVKDLRKQLKEAQKRAEAAEAEAVKNAKVVRQRTVADVLRDKQVNPGLARFVLQDLEDPTPESVNTWLTENGELFGIKPAEPASTDATNPGTQLPPDLIAQIERFTRSQGDTTHTDPQDALLSQVQNAESKDALIKLINSAGN